MRALDRRDFAHRMPAECVGGGTEHADARYLADIGRIQRNKVRLEIADNMRDLVLFNLAIDSKLRGCDLLRLMTAYAYAAGQVKKGASIVQSKTQKPVRSEISEGTPKNLTSHLNLVHDEGGLSA